MGIKDAELSVLITGDRRMRQLNREWRDIDKTTDVLSFSAMSADDGPDELLKRAKAHKYGPPLLLGDIVISAPKAAAQAVERGHSLGEELVFLLAHGLLHLLGHDHEDASERRRMEAKTKALIKTISASTGD